MGANKGMAKYQVIKGYNIPVRGRIEETQYDTTTLFCI